MAVPKYNELYEVFLKSLFDGEIHKKQECLDYIRQAMKLTDDELSEAIASGTPLWINRVNWCGTYLKKAGLVTSPARASFQITKEGQALLAEKVPINNALLEQRYPAFAEFVHPKQRESGQPASHEPEPEPAETPQETFERVYGEINAQLADELLTAVLSMSSIFFENLVIKLMMGMGYGGSAGSGFVTKASGDNGIDGIINEDQLGFNLIYVQAKRWAPDTTIGKPEIQKFVGALAGPPKIEKGLFITTAKFSQGAQEYADAQHVILVDGKKLTELMIQFNIGVTTQKRYEIKRIDSDFFEEI
ncbi:MAG: restriction endonuclease [Oscillospiraceae bacterium]|nr:restriction endonuclease [Oscillospiraceae bacterium]